VERWERLIWIAGRRRRVDRRHWASRDDWGIRASRKIISRDDFIIFSIMILWVGQSLIYNS